MSFLNLSLLLIPRVPSSAITLLTPHRGAKHLLSHVCPLVSDSEFSHVSSHSEPLSPSRLLFTHKKHLQRTAGPIVLKISPAFKLSNVLDNTSEGSCRDQSCRASPTKKNLKAKAVHGVLFLSDT